VLGLVVGDVEDDSDVIVCALVAGVEGCCWHAFARPAQSLLQSTCVHTHVSAFEDTVLRRAK
jgi:hypothetical protein